MSMQPLSPPQRGQVTRSMLSAKARTTTVAAQVLAPPSHVVLATYRGPMVALQVGSMAVSPTRLPRPFAVELVRKRTRDRGQREPALRRRDQALAPEAVL